MTQKHYGIWGVPNAEYLLTTGPDFISEILKSGKIWEEETLNYSEKLLADLKAPIVIDIGANLGAYSVPIAKSIQPRGGKVYAFEPQRPIYNQFCGNLFINGVSNCYTHHMAVGSYDGRIDVPVYDIHKSANNGGLSLHADIRKDQGWFAMNEFEQVSISKLDSLSLPPADLVKIDVEGLELEVVTGALHYLEKSGYPAIIFEVWGDYMKNLIEKKQRLLQLIESLGYVLWHNGETYIAQHNSKPIIEL